MPQVTLDRRPVGKATAQPAGRRGRYRGGHRTGPQGALPDGGHTAGYVRHAGRAARSRRSRSVALLALAGTLAGGGLAAIGIFASGGGGFTTTGAVALQPSAVASLPAAGGAEGAGSAIPTEPAFNFAPSPVVTGVRARRPSALRTKPTATASPTPAATTSAPPTAGPTTGPSAQPTATPPPPPVGTASCTNPVFTTSTLYGTYTALPYFVANNQWNAAVPACSRR